jgi:hypothetical protein
MDGRRMAGAIAGALVAGIGISALLIVGERKSGEPSELAVLERASARKVGLDDVPGAETLPGAGEQAIIQGGHLLLSAAAGAAYAATTDDEAGVLVSGIGFGLAFYAAMHWLAGPLLGVKRPEWRADVGTIGMHTANHLAFGLATAAGARLARR